MNTMTVTVPLTIRRRSGRKVVAAYLLLHPLTSIGAAVTLGAG
jgi:hypothetical protein